MAKFQFRLETLRKIRLAHRDAMRQKLAEAFQAAQVLEDQQQAVVAEIDKLLEQQRRTRASEHTNINTIVDAQRYQSVLRAQEQTLREQAAKLEAEIEKRRQLVVEADKEVRVLDKLEERQRDKHREEAMRLETKTLDEIGLSRWEDNSR